MIKFCDELNCATPLTSMNTEGMFYLLCRVVYTYYDTFIIFGNGLGIKKIFSSPQIISLVMVSIGVYARTVKHAGKWSSTDLPPFFMFSITCQNNTLQKVLTNNTVAKQPPVLFKMS